MFQEAELGGPQTPYFSRKERGEEAFPRPPTGSGAERALPHNFTETSLFVASDRFPSWNEIP